MRASIFAVVALCLVGTAACRTVEVRGPGGRTLAATTPRSMTMRRGEEAPLVIAIDRTNFTGPVKVSLSQLPKGVSVDRGSQSVETTQATFVLKASRQADLVGNQALMVVVEGPDGVRATQYIDLTVAD